MLARLIPSPRVPPFGDHWGQDPQLDRHRDDPQKVGNHGSIYSERLSDLNDQNVINLSSYNLSEDEIKVLSLGLNFCTEQHIDTFEVVKDLNLFSRNLLLKVMYGRDSNNIATSDTCTFSNSSPGDPLDEEILETFIEPP